MVKLGAWLCVYLTEHVDRRAPRRRGSLTLVPVLPGDVLGRFATYRTSVLSF
jgi:hypothetical protein